MWIQVRSIDGKKTVRIDSLSKLTKIEDLRIKLVEHFDAPAEAQRLFFRGKQLVDGHTLFDYNVGLNDLIQVMVRPVLPSAVGKEESKSDTGYGSGEDSDGSDKENKRPVSPKPEPAPSTTNPCDEEHQEFHDSIYKLGDIVDVRDACLGAWFEARITKVVRKTDEDETSDGDEKDKTRTGDSNNNSDDKTSSQLDTEMISDTKPETQTENCASKDSVKHEEMETENSDSVSGTDKSGTCDTDAKQSQKLCNGHEDKKTDPVKKEVESVDENDNNKSQRTMESVEKESENDDYLYHIIFDGYEDEDSVRSTRIRPRARNILKMDDINIGDRVMVNYNYEDPDQRGFWHDCIITKKRDSRTMKELYGTVFIGADVTPLEDCRLLFANEVFAIEKPGTQLNEKEHADNPAVSPAKRQNKPECEHCNDNPRRKCKFCACCVCGCKNDPDKQILCDECDSAYHLACLTPPLDTVPEEDEWYCPKCKVDQNEVVRAGEKLKESKKKSKMASATSKSSRDWGKGMACVGRTKECRIVPPNHFGPVPAAEVGMLWKFRVQASEAGVHRPHVAGIHGREDEGAYSIVLSGGYEDDVDNGDEFTYTGSGGRDLSGNKRTAEQSCDQVLTRMNKALAKNCNAPINSKNGADAGADWKGGKPVRVVRNCKGRKHSKYAPEEGNRYDGIYKIVKYWPEKGKSGFNVWRYLLRRDDPTPPPWSKEGKKRLKQLGFEMQYPEGYLEAQREKELQKEKEDGEDTPKGKGRKKRKAEESPENSPNKKPKVAVYKVEAAQMTLIKQDKCNKKLWDEALKNTVDGNQKFLQKVEEVFMCVCCQDLAHKPITLECSHNVCKTCLQRSFKAEVYSCPACRFELPKKYGMPVNQMLAKILNAFFPGYEAGRG